MNKKEILQNLLQIEEFLLSEIFYVHDNDINNDDMITAIQKVTKVISMLREFDFDFYENKFNNLNGKYIMKGFTDDQQNG